MSKMKLLTLLVTGTILMYFFYPDDFSGALRMALLIGLGMVINDLIERWRERGGDQTVNEL